MWKSINEHFKREVWIFFFIFRFAIKSLWSLYFCALTFKHILCLWDVVYAAGVEFNFCILLLCCWHLKSQKYLKTLENIFLNWKINSNIFKNSVQNEILDILFSGKNIRSGNEILILFLLFILNNWRWNFWILLNLKKKFISWFFYKIWNLKKKYFRKICENSL